MITRKIGSLLRGKSTPFQVSAACVLASWIAFVPGFAQGPGWIATLVALLLVLNANLGLAVLVLGPARLASMALVPTSFEVGRFLLDGPTRGVFAAMAASPGLAWFGLEHYVTVGGMVLGLGFGVVSALGVNGALAAFRRKMSAIERDSARYQELVARPWVKVLCFVFVGGRRKKSFEELAQRSGNPIRIAGVAVVAIAVVAGFLLRGLVASPLVTEALHTELARANGATVDLGSVELDLAGGRLTIEGLAIADPADLDTDLFRAKTLEADLDVGALLRRRFTIERLVVREAQHGARRATPGKLEGPAPAAPQKPEAETSEEGARTIDDYIEDAQVWKERLAKARGHIERIWGSEGDASASDESGADERLAERVRALGHAGVVSEGLVTSTPALTVTELVVEGLSIEGLAGHVFDVDARNLSTHPDRLAAAPRIVAKSRSGKIELALDGAAPVGEGLRFLALDVPIDEVASSLRVNGERVLEGGQVDLSLVGGWAGGRVGYLDLPLDVTVRGARVAVPGHGFQPVDELQLAIGLRGPLDAPRVRVDTDDLRKSLLAAGEARLRAEVDQVLLEAQAEAERLKAEATAEAERILEEEKLSLQKKQQKLRSRVESEAKQAVGDELTGRLGGLLSRKPKD